MLRLIHSSVCTACFVDVVELCLENCREHLGLSDPFKKFTFGIRKDCGEREQNTKIMLLPTEVIELSKGIFLTARRRRDSARCLGCAFIRDTEVYSTQKLVRAQPYALFSLRPWLLAIAYGIFRPG
jgi:hypothetical protein